MKLEWKAARKINQYLSRYRLESGPEEGTNLITWYGYLDHSKSGKCSWRTFGTKRTTTELPRMSLEEAKATIEAMIYLRG